MRRMKIYLALTIVVVIGAIAGTIASGNAPVLGLDKVDRAILETLCERFTGQPVGLITLAVTVGEAPDTIEDVYEPFLLKAGLMLRTPRGRVATPAAYVHLGVSVPSDVVPSLFET